jgi:iodotyrosine deiodinase
MTVAAAKQPLEFTELAPDLMAQKSQDFFKSMGQRRTVRDFSDRPVPRALIETAIRVAGTAPSGANQQPWTFVAISNSAIKAQIRAAAEIEEKAFYARRAGQDWLDALAHLGTDWEKPFLDTAPWLIAVFAKRWGATPSGEKIKHYYVPESVGIATGFLITALHMSGLVTLTHTPSPMGFLNKVCGRPESEKAVILMVVGYPASDAQVPIIGKKSFEDIAVFL